MIDNLIIKGWLYLILLINVLVNGLMKNCIMVFDVKRILIVFLFFV